MSRQQQVCHYAKIFQYSNNHIMAHGQLSKFESKSRKFVFVRMVEGLNSNFCKNKQGSLIMQLVQHQAALIEQMG